MKRKRVFVMCAPAGSGKSSWIRSRLLTTTSNSVVVSRDVIRLSLLREGEDLFAREEEVLVEFYRQINDYLNDDFTDDIYIDATHLTPKARRILRSNIHEPKDMVIWYIAVSVEVSADICVYRNSFRSGHADVPETVIRRMHNSFIIPKFNEAFKFHEIWHIDEYNNCKIESRQLMEVTV